MGHWAGMVSATGLAWVQPLGWNGFSCWAGMVSATRLVQFQLLGWYGSAIGLVWCQQRICYYMPRKLWGAPYLMQKILPCRYLDLTGVAITDQLRGPRAASPSGSSVSHSLKEPS